MSLRRAAAAVLVLVAGLLGLAAGPVAAQATGPDARAFVVAVPDLRWSDLAAMPRLRAFAAGSAVAELATRTLGETTSCADGAVTFSAGARADAPAGVTGCALTPAQLAAARAAARRDGYAAHVGALGDAVHAAGGTTAAVGAAAVAYVADSRGRVDTRPGSLAAAAAAGATVSATVDPQLLDATGAARAAAARRLDAVLATQLRALPAGATVLVAGTSDAARDGPHLHVLLLRGPGIPHAALGSASARAPYVQLTDLAPTLLAAVGVPAPAAMTGAAARPAAPARRWPAYADDDAHAVLARVLTTPIRGTLGGLGVVGVTLFALALRRGGRAAVAAVWWGRLAVGFPMTTFLVQLLPWWRWPGWAYALLLAAGCLAVATLVAVADRAGPVRPLVVAAALPAVVLVADQLAGARLQLSAPMGDNPLTAARFHGVGNIDFALLSAATLLASGVVAGVLRARTGRRAPALALAALAGLVLLVVDAAPTLGDDFGGVLTLVPAVAVLLGALAGLRPSPARVAAVAAAAVVVAAAVGAADYARPAAEQTHVGRFFGEVLHGGAGGVVRRKLDASLATFVNPFALLFLAAAVAVAVWLRAETAALLRRVPGLPEAGAAVLAVAVLGTLLNDSGVVVLEAALLQALFALLAAGVVQPATAPPAPCLPTRAQPAGDNGGAPRSRPTRSPA